MMENLDNLLDKEMIEELGRLGLEVTGSRAVLRERLRKAQNADVVANVHQDSNSAGIDDDVLPGTRGDASNGHDRDVNARDSACDVSNINKMSKKKLQMELGRLGLSTTGLKMDLKERLRVAMRENVYNEVGRNDDESDEDENEMTHVNQALNEDRGSISIAPNRSGTEERFEDRRSIPITRDRDVTRERSVAALPFGENEFRGRPLMEQPILSFKDVEDALETFSGNGTQNVRRWFTSFEETADLCRWSEIQKIVYLKKLLRGSAKLFANYECHAQSWRALRRALIEEFGTSMSSRQVHKELSVVSKKSNETYQEYVYRVLELASHSEMELESKIQYIIDGIKDDEVNKSILYGATTIKELRQRLMQYEAQQANRNKFRQPMLSKKKIPNQADRTGSTISDNSTRRCFNCGDLRHLGKDCPNKSKGSRCYACGEFGHIAVSCMKDSKRTNKSTPSVRVDALQAPSDKKTYKAVTILGKDTTAVIDPGSDLHLVRSSFYVQLGAPRIRQETVKFCGVGSIERNTLGRFTAEVLVDGLTIKLNIDVVPDHFMGHNFILGGELSDFAEVRICKRTAILTKIDETAETTVKEAGDINGEWSEVLCINTQLEIDDQRSDKVSLDHVINPKIRDRAREMINNYYPKKVKDSGVAMQIVLKDEVPVHQNPRRLSAEQRKTVQQIVKNWISEGVAQPSSSEYASPIVLAKKKNGDPRLCVDYRRLNKKIVRDRYPLPLMEDQLDRLAEATVYCTLDLKDGFFHVPVIKDSRRYTSFVTPDGQYEFLKVPFGLCNSPAVFQRHIRAVFRELAAKDMVLIYLDDLIIPAKEEFECLEKLEQVLVTASDYGLNINWRKCSMLAKRVEYLGHIVEAGTIRPSEKKIAAVSRFPKPTSTKAIQCFLGLTGYFRKFMPQYALIARPLSQLLKNGVKFVFEKEQEQAFENLKMMLSRDPVLKLYRVGAETEIHTDASRFGLGAILLQKNSVDGLLHPIYYASWKTVGAEERYSSYELEVLAVIRALRKFRVYLLGIPFRIITDCKAFTQTMAKKDACLRVAHWALQLEEYDYTVEHRAGVSMRHADALSRNPIECLNVQETHNFLTAQFRQAQAEDSDLQKTIRSVKDGSSKDFIFMNGVLFKENRGNPLLVVPRQMQQEMVIRTHERGHLGWRNTEHLMKQEFWFSRMRSKIKEALKNCVHCLLAEKKQGKAEGWLQPLNKDDRPLETYHVDFLGPISSTKKSYAHILAVVDGFSKFIWLYPTKSTTSEETIRRLEKQATIFGNPRRIISDRGTAFTSHVFQKYCQRENIQHILIATGVPRGNGQVERMNRIIIAMLTKLALSKAEEWYKHVSRVQQFMNSAFNRSIGTTSFEILIGQKMRLRDDPELLDLIQKEQYEAFQYDRISLRDEAKRNITKIQKENCKTFNRKRSQAKKYKVGDIVAIRRTQLGPGLKVSPKFLGPYQIIRTLRNDRYLIKKIGEHEGPNTTSTAVDYLKSWPQHRGWDPEIDLPSGIEDSSDGESDDDGPDSKDSNNPLDIGDDVKIRTAECGNDSNGLTNEPIAWRTRKALGL